MAALRDLADLAALVDLDDLVVAVVGALVDLVVGALVDFGFLLGATDGISVGLLEIEGLLETVGLPVGAPVVGAGMVGAGATPPGGGLITATGSSSWAPSPRLLRQVPMHTSGLMGPAPSAGPQRRYVPSSAIVRKYQWLRMPGMTAPSRVQEYWSSLSPVGQQTAQAPILAPQGVVTS